MQSTIVIEKKHRPDSGACVSGAEPEQYPVRRQEHSAEDKLHARLLSYLDLTDDWDGYGAAPPSIDAVLDAVDFLVMCPRDVPLPFPRSRRTVRWACTGALERFMRR